MFEQYRKKVEKVKDLFSFKKVAGLVGTSLMCLGLVGGKVQAQDIPQSNTVQNSDQEKQILVHTNQDFFNRNSSLLKKEKTLEEEANIQALRGRLKRIGNNQALSTAEVDSSVTTDIDSERGLSGNEFTITTQDKEVLFLDDNGYTDILTQDNTQSLKYNVQKEETIIEQVTPTQDTFLTTTVAGGVQDETGDYRSLVNQKSGYIKQDGSIDINVKQHGSQKINRPNARAFKAGDVLPDSFVNTLKQPGLLDRDTINDFGFTSQSVVSTQPTQNTQTNTNTKKTYGFSVDNTQTLKKVSLRDHGTYVSEVVRSQSVSTNTETPAIDLGLSALSAVLPTPLDKDLTKASEQHKDRLQNASNPGGLTVKNMTGLKKISALKQNSQKEIDPRLQYTRIIAPTDSHTTSFYSITAGHQTIDRKQSFTNSIHENKSKFNNVFTTGGETDTSFNGIIEFNGERVLRNENTSTLGGRDLAFGLHAYLDTQDYTSKNSYTEIITRVAEPQVEISGGVQHKNLGLAVRTGFGYDGSEKKLYPTISLFSQLGDSNSSNLTVSGEYSAHPGISNPNQVQIAASVPVTLHEKKTQDYSTPNYIQTITKPASAEVEGSQKKLAKGVSDRFVIKPYVSKEIDLGGNDVTHKTSFKAGLTALYSRKTAHLRDNWNSDQDTSNDYTFGSTQIGATLEKTLKATENSNEGYLLKAFVRRNWLTIQAVFSKLNNTNTYSIGASAYINNSLSMDGSYSQSNRPGDLFDDSTVKLNIRYTH